MADTLRQAGDYLQIVAGGTYTSGTPVKVGTALFGIPVTDATSGQNVALAVKGVHELPKTGGAAAYSIGDRCYWSGSVVTKTATDDYIGVCTKAAGAGATVVELRINGEVGAVTDADSVDGAGAVMESDYNANTILKADSDNTPIPLTVGASRIVGRGAAGNIDALTPSSARGVLLTTSEAEGDELLGARTVGGDRLVKNQVGPVEQKVRAIVALADADATLTASQLVNSGVFSITPGAARALTTATAAEIVAAISGATVGTSFEISIACLAAFAVTLTAGVGVTITGSGVVNNISGSWVAVLTNVTGAAEAVTFVRK